MKQNTKWLMTALAVAAGLIIANFAQAQYILGNGASAGIASAHAPGANLFTGANVTTVNGLELSGSAYSWDEWDIPVAQQVVYNPNDNKIIFNYTILSPTPAAAGGSGPGSGMGCSRYWVPSPLLILAAAALSGILDMMATTSVTGFPMDRALRTRMQGMCITRRTNSHGNRISYRAQIGGYRRGRNSELLPNKHGSEYRFEWLRFSDQLY